MAKKKTKPEESGDKPKRGRPATGVTPKRYFRMANDEHALVVKAAETLDVSTSEFIRETTLAKARSVLKSK